MDPVAVAIEPAENVNIVLVLEGLLKERLERSNRLLAGASVEDVAIAPIASCVQNIAANKIESRQRIPIGEIGSSGGCLPERPNDWMPEIVNDLIPEKVTGVVRPHIRGDVPAFAVNVHAEVQMILRLLEAIMLHGLRLQPRQRRYFSFHKAVL
jgi:hypothetical protein